MDETSAQCLREVCDPIPAKAAQSERYDLEYERNGVAHVMAFYAPFEYWRRMEVADNHTAEQWAERVRQLVLEDYPPGKAHHLSHGQSEYAYRCLTVQSLSAGRGAFAAG
jgi:hypothetical protein